LDNQTEANETFDDLTEQQIRLEEARKARIEAEMRQEKSKSLKAAWTKAQKTAKKIPAKVIAIVSVVALACILVLTRVVIPLAFDGNNTQRISIANLKEVVNVERLSTVEYEYHGIAEKTGKFLWADTVDYRVKYEAHTRAYVNMTDIEFSINEEDKTVIAYIPEATIDTPTLDETQFGFLPESVNADMKDIIALCKEDAVDDLNKDQILKVSSDSLKSTVKALTLPLLDDEWNLEFKNLAEYNQNGAEDNETA
jgi:hypothetical protein